MTRGVVYKEGEEFKMVNPDQKPPEKTGELACKHCGKEYKLKMHLVPHEKKCKQKE